MVKVEGYTVAIEVSLLASVMDTPPEGATVPNDTGKLTVLPGMTVTLTGNRMPPAAGCVTLTVAVALGRLTALAVIVTVPPDAPVTGTETLVAPVPKLTAAGTAATVALLELRVTASGAEAGADRLSVRFWVELPLIVRFTGEKLIVTGAGFVRTVT